MGVQDIAFWYEHVRPSFSMPMVHALETSRSPPLLRLTIAVQKDASRELVVSMHANFIPWKVICGQVALWLFPYSLCEKCLKISDLFNYYPPASPRILPVRIPIIVPSAIWAQPTHRDMGFLSLVDHKPWRCCCAGTSSSTFAFSRHQSRVVPYSR